MANSIKYKDCFAAGYKVTPVNQSNTEFTDNINKIHVRLTRDDVDYKEFFDNCIVSINGFYHLLDTDYINGVLVLDAVKSLNISRQNQMGILSFKQLGGIQRHLITDEMMTTYLDDDLEVGNVRINIPFDITNKSIIFCLGGYLRYVDNSKIIQTSDNVFKINFNNMSMLDCYYESKKYIDLSSLPLEHSIFNQEHISLSQLISAENLRAYLKLSQSFIMVVNTPSISLETKHVRKTGLPGMYISYTKPELPLVVGNGRHAEYIARLEDGQYGINIYDNVIDNRLYDTVLRQSLTTTDGSRRPDWPGMYDDAYLLNIISP